MHDLLLFFQCTLFGIGGCLGGGQTGGPGTPTLVIAGAKVGLSGNQSTGRTSLKFGMEASGSPRAVTAGELIVMNAQWPSGITPTFIDDKGNTWSSTSTCTDSQSTAKVHGIVYAQNAAASTSVITETFSAAHTDNSAHWMHFYNVAISSAFETGSCGPGRTPANNTPPNITGPAFSTTSDGDLIIVCVHQEWNTGLGYNYGSAPNTNWTSVAPQANFTLIFEEDNFGQTCAYGIQTTHGSFTPSFTVAQGTHTSFTIMAAAFKAGGGGTAPAAGLPSVLLTQMLFNAGQIVSTTHTVNLPCPIGTTDVDVQNDAGTSGVEVTAVSDSNADAYTIIHDNSDDGSTRGTVSITNPNTFTVTLTFGTLNGNDLIRLACLTNTNGIDTGATAANSSTITSANSGFVFNAPTESSTTLSDAPSETTSLANDLLMQSGQIGNGPATACLTAKCSYDYVNMNVAGDSSDDANSYNNGDLMAHVFVSTASTVNMSFTVINNSASTGELMGAFKKK